MIVERIKEFADSKGLNTTNFEQIVGVSNATFNKAFKKNSSIGTDTLEKVLNAFPELSPVWVLTGEGEMIKSEASVEPGLLPLIPLEAFAGPGEPAYDDIPGLTFYSVNEFYGSDFLIRVKGDSMTPKYNGGDIVACKKITDMLFFQWGRIYVLYTQSQGVMIKRIQPSEREDCIKCVSDNEKYAPFDVPKSDIVSLALVNGSISLE